MLNAATIIHAQIFGVFGMKNRIGYELALSFSHNAYSVLLLLPIQFSDFR